jgi:hypothetical protein
MSVHIIFMKKAWFLNKGDIGMETTLQGSSQGRSSFTHATLAKGIGWGLIGGLVGTLVMDLILMVLLSALGDQALSCFSIVGDTGARFFSILGIEMAGGVPLGVATHYTVGPIVGVIFGASATRVDALRVATLKQRVVLAVLYVEILSVPLLALTPLLLKTTTSETLLWFGGSSVMHFICGSILGVIVNYGLHLSPD